MNKTDNRSKKNLPLEHSSQAVKGKKLSRNRGVAKRFRTAIICLSALVVVSMITCIGYDRFNTVSKAKALSGCLVCIDPGHGFGDPGTAGEFLGDVTEAEINMSISQRLAEELKKKGFSVVFTHDGSDIPVGTDVNNNGIFDPEERVTYSDSFDSVPAVFISIHCDSFPSDPSVNGTRLYYQDGSDRGVLSGLLRSVANEISVINGTRRAPIVKSMSQNDAYTVICDREKSSAFLIECGFVTNADDAARLISADWQSSFAKAIADGMYKYCNK